MEWKEVSKSSLLNSGRFLVLVARGQIQIASFNSTSGKWESESRPTGLHLAVSHWMSLPALPGC